MNSITLYRARVERLSHLFPLADPNSARRQAMRLIRARAVVAEIHRRGFRWKHGPTVLTGDRAVAAVCLMSLFPWEWMV